MIAYLEGRLLKKDTDRIVLLAGGVGYEILLPAFVMKDLDNCAIEDELALYIYFHQTERTPRPVLIGFHHEKEREFFEMFISVETIGPLKAVKALTLPVEEIAAAIEAKDAAFLKKLTGIGERVANKIVATLHGKTARFGRIRKAGEVPGGGEYAETGMDQERAADVAENDFAVQVMEVLVSRLGYKNGEAREMVAGALKRNPAVDDPESLFEEVFRGRGRTGEVQR